MHSPHKQYKIRKKCGECQVYCLHEAMALAQASGGASKFLSRAKA
jgi:Pyruvate/2-oxoacid:ferredoxin oxidoreductase delta subunit